MKIVLILLCLSTVALTNSRTFGQTSSLPAQFSPHLWTASIKVIGEDGNPIVGADISVQYTIPVTPVSGQPTYGEIKGITDTDGVFSTSHVDSSWGLGITVNKSSYYTTHGSHQFFFDENNRHPHFTLILKKISKPIALYAKQNTSLVIPEFNKAIGYDFTVGDWVAPYGKGINTDILFTENHMDKSGYTFTVSFPNQGDGIQEFSVPLLLQNAVAGQSDLRSSSEAPLNGYQHNFVQINHDSNRNFYFRVRAKLDENGNVISAHYGKIYGDLPQFTYYYNPTPNDHNLEFDPKQNLLNGLQSFERVAAP